eukprot:INCI16082.2.p1 GENE.INCI16082.2~~INCI16082.2.p1  ORF type:complete len:376 (-),score=42.92 INCI16082.2:332-1459(-)
MLPAEVPAEVYNVVVGAVALVAVVLVALSAYVARAIVYPPFSRPRTGRALSKEAVSLAWGDKHTDPKHDFGIDFEDVEFQSVCGSTLRGWFIDRRSDEARQRVSRAVEGGEARDRPHKRSKDDIVVVFVHGGGRDRRAFLRHTPLVCEAAGYSALLYDARGHGASDLDHVGLSMGIREHEDAMAAVNFARGTLGFESVVLIGTSVGAYSSILATARLPEEAVLGVIAENPFTSIRDNVRGIVLNLACRRVVCRRRERLVKLASPCRWVMDHLVWWLVARSLGKAAHLPNNEALTVIEGIRQPLLLMHGDSDHLIHHDHTHALFEAAAEPKDVWIAPEADHCALLNVHPEEYERRVLGFLEARLREFEARHDRSVP